MDVHFSRSAVRRGLLALGASLLGIAAGMHPALATPLPQSVSGTLNHGASITITELRLWREVDRSACGLGQRDRERAISDMWTGAWPDKLPGYNTGLLRADAQHRPASQPRHALHRRRARRQYWC